MSRQLSDHVMVKKWVVKWVFYLVGAFLLITVIACLMVGHYYSENEKNKDNAIYWNKEYNAAVKK